jgi:hypothetical protein
MYQNIAVKQSAENPSNVICKQLINKTKKQAEVRYREFIWQHSLQQGIP